MLAIVIPFYKITFFKETLASLSLQSNKNFNVYIGNDASPDDPEALINFFGDEIKLIYKKFDQNLGSTSLTSHWQRCLHMVQDEEWVMVLGDDDMLQPTVVANWYENAAFSSKYNIFRFATIVIDEAGNNRGIVTNPEKEAGNDAFIRRLTGRTRSSLSEFIFRKSCYETYGFKNFPLAWHADDFAWLQYSNERGIYAINAACVYIRISQYSISGTKDNLSTKKNAKSLFLEEVIKSQLFKFNKKQANLILKEYEIALKDCNQMDEQKWHFLFPYYLRHFSLIPLLKFTRRFFIK